MPEISNLALIISIYGSSIDLCSFSGSGNQFSICCCNSYLFLAVLQSQFISLAMPCKVWFYLQPNHLL